VVKNYNALKRFLCTKTLPFSLIFLLCFSGVVNAVWIYEDTDFLAGGFTFNVRSAQNLSYIAHNGNIPFTNLSWDGSNFYNITYVSNITSTQSLVELNGAHSIGTYTTTISFDLWSPTTYTTSGTSVKIVTANNATETITESYTQSGMNRQYSFTYNPSNTLTDSDMGDFGLNVTATVSNTTLIYTGYWFEEDLFTVYELDPPTGITSGFNTTYTSINTSWTLGNNSDQTLVMRSNTGYPSTPTDGTSVQNNTDTYYNASINPTETYYYTLFSYNITTNSYSTGVNMPWGGIQFQCFNESNPSQALSFDIEITNSDASSTYTASGLSNGDSISLDDIPYGDDTVFIISSSGYRDRTYYYDLVQNQYYNHTYYLPPITNVVDDSEDSDTPPERRTKTDVAYVNNISQDVTINTAYTIDDIIQVYQYNSSIYGGWVSIPVDNYTATSTSVLINHSIFDENTTMVRVDYYYYHYENTTETHLYFIKIIDEAGEPINDAKVTVQKYMTSTDTYETVAILLTGGYGYCSEDFVPGTLYRITGNKTGYTNNSAYWTTDPNNYGMSNPKIIQLALIEPSFVNETSFNEAISFTATMDDTTGVINISYSDSLEGTQTTNIIIYQNGSSWYYDNRTDDNSFQFDVTGNTTKTYEIVLTVYHAVFGLDTTSISLYVIGPDVPGRNLTNTTTFNNFFTNVFGDNSLGWAAIFVQFILLGAVFTFGPRNSGLGSMLAGGLCLFINIVLGITVLGTLIPLLFIIFGIIRQWRMMNKEAV